MTRDQAVEWLRQQVGNTWMGTNPSDRGECLGFISVYMRQITGEGGYAIQGAEVAADMIEANNTRPDLFTQVVNDPNDLGQLPSVGDIMIYKKTAANGWCGHIAAAVDVNVSTTTSVEQNWVPHTVTYQVHNYAEVLGWIHVNFAELPAPAETAPQPPQDVPAPQPPTPQLPVEAPVELPVQPETIPTSEPVSEPTPTLPIPQDNPIPVDTETSQTKFGKFVSLLTVIWRVVTNLFKRN